MKKKYKVLLDVIKECLNYCVYELLFYILLELNIIFCLILIMLVYIIYIIKLIVFFYFLRIYKSLNLDLNYSYVIVF